ncbi:cysteine hydrolase family protein [Streptomyces sp. NPDC004044]
MTEANTTALLVGHIQPPVSQLPEDDAEYCRGLQILLNGARNRGVLVIYVNVGFLPGYPELPASSAIRDELAPHGIFIDGVSNAVDERVAPLDGDISIVSPGPDIFARSSLASILRAKGIGSIAVMGISTGGVVNGMVVGAYSEGLDVVVLKDLCFEPAGDDQDALFSAFVRPWGASITTSNEWLDAVKPAGTAL